MFLKFVHYGLLYRCYEIFRFVQNDKFAKDSAIALPMPFDAPVTNIFIYNFPFAIYYPFTAFIALKLSVVGFLGF